ncbi:MAG: endonuclease [Flavobacterium sp.]|nr:endonuclease [Flavobacterium sp.]
MKKIYTFSALLYVSMLLAQAGAPAVYYNGFNWTQTGTALKSALATKITTTHTNQLSYSQIWNALEITDKDPANAANVLLIYGYGTSYSRDKDLQCGGGNCNGTWNREHTYAQSIGTPNIGTSGPGADAHHLRACDYGLNEDRASEKYADGTGNAHDVTSSTWYPGDEWKGDIARMMMYMYLRYGDQCLPKNVGIGTTLATDSNMIDLFLQWNVEDPVSTFEDNRNTYLGNANNTYGQGNRNPFIDNPYLATVIWGGTAAENRWPNVAFLSVGDFNMLSNVAVYPNPANDHKINIQTEVILDEINLVNVNGQLVQQIKKPVLQNNTYTMENLPNGFYFLKMTSGNQSTVKKIIVN